MIERAPHLLHSAPLTKESLALELKQLLAKRGHSRTEKLNAQSWWKPRKHQGCSTRIIGRLARYNAERESKIAFDRRI